MISEQPLPATYTRRRVLTSTAGIGAAALLTGCSADAGAAALAASSSSSATLQVDFGKSAFFPLLKSKIAVGRALDSTEILDSLQYLDEIRPALYNGELRFPDTSYPSLTPYPIEVAADGAVQVQRNQFLDTLFTGLRQRKIEVMVQLEGAPKQWPTDLPAERPHLFPIPTDLATAAEAVGKWAKLYSDYPINWCMWNEPSHNLTGTADLTSISQLIDIYGAYTSAIAPQGLFGMASFLPENAQTDKNLGTRTYLAAAIDELRQRRKTDPGLPFDYLTMNNYGESLYTVIDGARDALSTDFNTVPLIQAQFGVLEPGDWVKKAGTTLEAAQSMTALEKTLEIPDLQTFTFAGWIGHLIDYKNGKALQLPLLNALKLYARMPDSRVQAQGQLPTGVSVMASGDAYRSSIMVWNETSEPRSITLDLSHMAIPGQSATELDVYLIDSEHGSPLEHGAGAFTPTETVPVSGSSGSLSKTVTVAGPGIAYIEIGTTSPHPALDRSGLTATLVRKHTYADRISGPKGKTTVRGNAYGCYDAVRAIAYTGVEGQEGTALCGAQYSALPDTLNVNINAQLPASHPKSAEALFAIRIDYMLADGAAKSVLWHGDTFESRRTTPLPWGRGGPTADVLVHATALDRAQASQGKLVLTLATYAPPGWAAAGREAIISFWMESTGPGSQARFMLG